MKTLGHDSWCPGQNLGSAPPKYNPSLLGRIQQNLAATELVDQVISDALRNLYLQGNLYLILGRGVRHPNWDLPQSVEAYTEIVP